MNANLNMKLGEAIFIGLRQKRVNDSLKLSQQKVVEEYYFSMAASVPGTLTYSCQSDHGFFLIKMIFAYFRYFIIESLSISFTRGRLGANYFQKNARP